MITKRPLPGICLTALTLLALTGCSQDRPQLGISNNYLQPCANRPNCVSSHPRTPDTQKTEPLRYQGEQRQAFRQLLFLLQNREDAIVVEMEHAHYIRADFRTRIIGFIDDVEFFFQQPGVIAVRSASRVGYSDFGVNRRRIEEIRQQFDIQMSQPKSTGEIRLNTD